MRLLGVVALVAVGGVACASARKAEPRCRLSGITEQWLEGSIVSWQHVRTRQLRLADAATPELIVYDRYCVYHFRPNGEGPNRLRAGLDTLRSSGRPHGGEIGLPNGLTVPARAEAFASLLPGDTATFLVMALEDVWRNDPRYRTDPEDWPSFLRRSFVHEMTHTRQLVAWAPMLRIAAAQVGLTDFDDDVIQQRFDTAEGFRRAVLEETAMLYDAASATSREQQGLLARRAIERMRLRRERAYGGVDAPWARIEQLLLDMEGAAQWAAMAHIANTTRIGAEARRNIIRGNRQYWSQDEGLALYLVLDALVPGWQDRMFSADPPSTLDLLDAALRR